MALLLGARRPAEPGVHPDADSVPVPSRLGRQVARAAVGVALASLCLRPGAMASDGHRAAGPPTPRPSHTAAASPSPEPAAAPPAERPRTIRYRTRGARVDLGWTGIAHDQPWPEHVLEFTLVCRADGPACSVSGEASGTTFGAPVPLSAGGVPACVVNRLRTPPSGTIDAASGCGGLVLQLTATVFLAGDVAVPCPTCRGDAVERDGRKDGTCTGGARAGHPCDAESTSALFGATSNDCPPSGQSVAELAIDLVPLTTGTLRIAARVDCARTGPGEIAPCFCPGQARPNACDTGVCGDGEHCTAEGPIDGACSAAPYRSCRPGSATADCESLVPGAGTCENRTRRCFGSTIQPTGACSPTEPTYVAVFCVAATRAPALNNAAGLPGPARLVLPLVRLEPDHPERADAGDAQE